MYNILVTGGSGYKGSLLVGKLLKNGHKVHVLDNFMYGYESCLEYASNPNFSATNKDIRNINEHDVKDYDIIFHLAAISGYEACKANPYSAYSINVNATKNIVHLLSKGQIMVYASTTSMFGKNGQVQNEESVIKPTSIYGKTKYEAEQICMSRENSIAYRFATLFGVSKKMRPELLLNDFIYSAINHRSLVLFDAHSKRTFLHVSDAIEAYTNICQNPDLYLNNIFNVGSDSMNFSKLEIANLIKKHIDFEIINSSLADFDKRDFIIDFSKIKKTGFEKKVELEEGIIELIHLYKWYKRYSPFNII